MVDWLPPRAQEIMLWSPLVHAIEMFRSGLFPEDFPTEWDVGYLALSAFILTAVGLPFFHYAQRHVQAP
jgi:capsular polysaccharide transport system permease protein